VARTKQEWLQLARARILSILAERGVCPIRMLEAKISEAGPGDKRPNPLSITLALRDLVNKGNVKMLPKKAVKDTPFYLPGWVDPESAAVKEPFFMRLYLYRLHKMWTEQNQYCSDVLETIVDKAIGRAGIAKFVSRFPNQHLPPGRPLDSVFDVGGVLCGCEAKNYREWIYPDSYEVWAALSKCCELDAAPVFVTRKLPYVTRVLFGKVGVLGYETHFQYFHPVIEPELTRIRDVDGLGYKDIKTTLEPDENLVRFFGTTVAKHATDFKKRFQSAKGIIQEFADQRELGNRNLNLSTRAPVFAEAWRALFGDKLSEDLEV